MKKTLLNRTKTEATTMNKPRPDCPVCGEKLSPLFRKAPRSEGYIRAGNAFQCVEHPNVVAIGRGKGLKFIAGIIPATPAATPSATPAATPAKRKYRRIKALVSAEDCIKPKHPHRGRHVAEMKTKPVKTKAADIPVAEVVAPKKRLGRPKGSKNKPKPVPAQEPIAAAA